MDWLSTVVLMLLSALVGALAGGFSTDWFNVRFSRKQDKKARDARLQGLAQEIEANILLVDAPKLTGQGGKPRLLIKALQKSQEDWLTLETTLQENLQKLHSEISNYNDRVDLFFSREGSGLSHYGDFFGQRSPAIKLLLKACQEDIRSITSRDPKK